MYQLKNLGSILLVLAVLGAAGYALTRPKTAVAPYPAPSIALPAGTYVEHGQYYDITANYATSTPLSASANARAIALMQSFIADQITEFKENGHFDNLTPRDIQMMGYDRGRKQMLQILYLISSSKRTASYIYTIYMDTLGAHGNTTFKTFTFDKVTGGNLSLADLFIPGSDYLGTLSSISRTELMKNMAPYGDQQEINAGTEPTADNFQSFFVDNASLDLLFPPYQVGPYAAGPQTVQIPLSQLSDILRPVYR